MRKMDRKRVIHCYLRKIGKYIGICRKEENTVVVDRKGFCLRKIGKFIDSWLDRGKCNCIG